MVIDCSFSSAPRAVAREREKERERERKRECERQTRIKGYSERGIEENNNRGIGIE
jgi:hypothetical protein